MLLAVSPKRSIAIETSPSWSGGVGRSTMYELGYRAQPSARSSVSVSADYNVYDDLRSFEFTGGRFPLVFSNAMEGKTYGLEAWGAYQLADWWRMSAGLVSFKL